MTISAYKEPKILSKNLFHPDEEIYLELKPAKICYFVVPICLLMFSFAFPGLFYISIPAVFIAAALYGNKSYALTNKRILSVKGVINKYRSECPLDKIQNIELKVPFLSGNTGTIHFITAGTFKAVDWDFIFNPRDVYQRVSAIIHKY